MKHDKLRIALVSPLWTCIPPQTYGGVELVLKLLADELVARGHEVTLFASADCSTKAELVPVLESNLTDLMAEGKAASFEYYASAAMADVLRDQSRFDVVHFHCSLGWLPLAATMKTPALFTMHTAPHHDDDWVMQRYPSVAVNGVSKGQMHPATLRLGREFPIIHNGCDFDAYEPSYEPGRYLAYIGRFSDGKNPLDAIRIAQTAEIPIVLAGQPQNGAEQRYFESEIKPLIDGESVRLVGPVNFPQKNELLRNAAALLFPIQWEEPFGLVMIEAMACGTPVLAHRRGSVEEVIDVGVTGYHAGVIDGMTELVPKVLELDRRAVREQAKQRFSHEIMVSEYEALYRQVIRDTRRRRVGPRPSQTLA